MKIIKIFIYILVIIILIYTLYLGFRIYHIYAVDRGCGFNPFMSTMFNPNFEECWCFADGTYSESDFFDLNKSIIGYVGFNCFGCEKICKEISEEIKNETK